MVSALQVSLGGKLWSDQQLYETLRFDIEPWKGKSIANANGNVPPQYLYEVAKI